MKIGLLGTQYRINRMKLVIEKYFPEIQPIYFHEKSYYYEPELGDELIKAKNNLDGFVFAGELVFQNYNKIFYPDVPTAYIAKDWTSLQSALLNASLKGIDIGRVSIDSYASSMVDEIYSGLELQESVHILKRGVFNSAYAERILGEHIHFFESGQVSGCITSISSIYDRLTKLDIPTVYVYPTTEAIVKAINHVKDTYDVLHSLTQDVVILIIHIVPKKEYSHIRKDEYLYTHEKIKVAEEVYYFAKNTNAAVVSDSLNQFIVLMNQKDFLEYTNGLQRFYLLNSIQANTDCDVNIGVGYGNNPGIAKYNANLAIEKCDGKQVNQTYIVSNSHTIIGPLDFLTKNDTTQAIDEKVFADLTSRSQISQNLIFKIYTLMEKNKRNSFTTLELAQLLNMSQRNASRLIHKLEDSGFAQLVGSKSSGSHGRPSDVYWIDFKL